MSIWLAWNILHVNSLSSAEAPVSKHQWKKKEGSGSAGNDNLIPEILKSDHACGVHQSNSYVLKSDPLYSNARYSVLYSSSLCCDTHKVIKRTL